MKKTTYTVEFSIELQVPVPQTKHDTEQILKSAHYEFKKLFDQNTKKNIMKSFKSIIIKENQ